MSDNPAMKGSFWFPENTNVKFVGNVEKGKFGTIYLESPPLEHSIDLDKILFKRETIIHGLLLNSQLATFIVSLTYSKKVVHTRDHS
jgi:hypothetical protein